MSDAHFVARFVAAMVAVALPAAGLGATQTAAQSLKQHAEACSRYGAARLLDCACVEKEVARLLGAEKAAPSDVVFDRAAAACPSAVVKAYAEAGDPRWRHHTFEERQAIRRIALEFVAALDADSERDAVARILSTPWWTAMLERTPALQPQLEQRVREVLARRTARGKLTDRRVGVIGAAHVQIEARAARPLPGIAGDAAYAAVEIVKITWSANGDPELAEYDFPY